MGKRRAGGKRLSHRTQLCRSAVGFHRPTVYLKQADASGKPTLKIYDLVERTETAPNAPQKPGVEFVTRKEFDALAALVGELKGKKKRKEDDDDE